MKKLVIGVVLLLFGMQAYAQEIGAFKINPFLIGHYQGYLEVKTLPKQSAQISFAYTPNTSESKYVSSNGVVEDQTIKATTRKVYVAYRFYNDQALVGGYWTAFGVYKQKEEYVTHDITTDNGNYNHARDRQVYGLGAMYGRQIELGRRFVIDIFGGAWAGTQRVDNIQFDSQSQTVANYEENILGGKSFNRFRWSPRLGVSLGYRL